MHLHLPEERRGEVNKMAWWKAWVSAEQAEVEGSLMVLV